MTDPPVSFRRLRRFVSQLFVNEMLAIAPSRFKLSAKGFYIMFLRRSLNLILGLMIIVCFLALIYGSALLGH